MERKDAIISLGFTAAVTVVMLGVAIVAAAAGEWLFATIALVLAIPYRRPGELRRLGRIALGKHTVI